MNKKLILTVLVSFAVLSACSPMAANIVEKGISASTYGLVNISIPEELSKEE